MNLTIAFTETEEARIGVFARQTGLAPEEFVRRLNIERLGSDNGHPQDAIDAKLRQWQEEDGTPLMPEVPASTLFARWAEEDAKMTDQERDAEDKLWEEIEKGLAQNRGLRLRQLGL